MRARRCFFGKCLIYKYLRERGAVRQPTRAPWWGRSGPGAARAPSSSGSPLPRRRPAQRRAVEQEPTAARPRRRSAPHLPRRCRPFGPAAAGRGQEFLPALPAASRRGSPARSSPPARTSLLLLLSQPMAFSAAAAPSSTPFLLPFLIFLAHHLFLYDLFHKNGIKPKCA